MSSRSTPQTTTSDLTAQLAKLGLHALADGCDDFIARATTGRWSVRSMLEELAHHADVTVIKGESYRVRESEIERAARRSKRCTKKTGKPTSRRS